ncbi:M12 family metallo-peptidase [Pseudomonas sp. BJa5]|uniref:M12 family metallo-peptidase n=1 Tax=Pseudomonas sp. BJa5 TaxID=2936270 RepID=UPI00255A11D6|nr:M12 family metallo-peptidase [Pseudomonas sp. BGr12]MDL2424104.1 M12 family metallo-peptidase [Pseudomonas sp. BGr12]
MANNGLHDSQINLRYENAGVVALDWTEPDGVGFSQMLIKLRDTQDSDIGLPASSQRESTRADLVALLAVHPKDRGLAYTNATKAFGFSVVHALALPDHTLAHELGHNLGARHNPEQYVEPVTPPYAHGIRWPGKWRSVMAYYCEKGQECNRVNYWSNPDLTYQGLPLGTQDKNNNARVLRDNAARIANFYPDPAPEPVPPSVTINIEGHPVAPANLLLLAQASAAPGASIRRVEFLRSGQVIGEDDRAPYQYQLNGVGVGDWKFAARAIDSAGRTGTSAEKLIEIGEPDTPPPSVTIDIEGGHLAPADLLLRAQASAAPGASIRRVEFLRSGQIIGEDDSAPYQYQLNGVGVGDWKFAARAIDSAGRTGTSAEKLVEIGEPDTPPPSVTIDIEGGHLAPASVPAWHTTTHPTGARVSYQRHVYEARH